MESDQIFSSLIETYEQKNTVQQKQALVKQTVEKVKLSELVSVQQQLHSQYEKIVKILKNHPQHAVQLVFSKLIVQDFVRLMKHSQTQELELTKQNVVLRLLDEVGKNIDSKEDQAFIEWFSKMYTKYSGMQKVIIFMQQLTRNYAHKYTHHYLPQFISDFINSSRLVVEAYLKLKAQAPKYDYEFMEHGDYITKSTETWMKDFYVQFLRKIGVPNTNELKLAVLNGVCDIIGAVLEVQREGNIEFGMCNQILEECFRYTKKVTTLVEFNQLYLKKLGQCGFNIPNNKIIIPTRYPSNLVTFPKQSYAFIVFKFLQQSAPIYSHQTILNYLIPLINQMAPFEYEIKTQIQTLFVQVLTSNQAQIKTCFQGGFPLSILYFNIWHYSSKKNQAILFALDKLFQKIRKENAGKFVNNLRILSNLKIENEENEINEFIGMKALQVAGSNPDLVVGLIKQIRFGNTNEKGESLWRQVVGEIVKTKEVKQKVERMFRQRVDKNKFEKQLQKTVLE